MRRAVLDELARTHHLSAPAVALALDLTGARPDRTAWREFTRRLSNAAGIAALGAGVIFFVAANWQEYGVIGRFAILQAAFLACVGIALWRPPPDGIGQAGVVLAMLLTGALLALFGQSYQTGADVHELFFAWAWLALPLALAGRCGAAWAVWWIVLNVGLGLYIGLLDQVPSLWRWLDGNKLDRAVLLFVPCIVNLAGAAAFHAVGKSKLAGHAPRWLVRMLATLGFAFGTAACIWAASSTTRHGAHVGMEVPAQAVTAAFAIISAGLAAATLHGKRDVFPLALIAASWIAISTAFIIVNIRNHDLGTFFLLSVWLIVTSTAAAFALMRWVRQWRVSEDASRAPP